MAKDPAFLFYSDAFLAGVQDLTMEERGQYITLLCVQHQKGFLTKKMIGICVGNAAADVLAKFRHDENGNFYNERLRLEAEKRAEYSEKQRQRAEKRWEKDKKDHDAAASTMASAVAMPYINKDINKDIDVIKDRGVGKGKKIEIVFPFTSEVFLKTWAIWKQYKQESGHKYKSPISEQAALKKLSTETEQTAIAMLEQSMSNNWQGIFPIKNTQANGKQSFTNQRTELERLSDEAKQRLAEHYNGHSAIRE